ncbi:hypothetical protein NPIL_495551, partial [Nephila pilipes]
WQFKLGGKPEVTRNYVGRVRCLNCVWPVNSESIISSLGGWMDHQQFCASPDYQIPSQNITTDYILHLLIYELYGRYSTTLDPHGPHLVHEDLILRY